MGAVAVERGNVPEEALSGGWDTGTHRSGNFSVRTQFPFIVYIVNCVVTQKIRDMDAVAAPAGPFCYRHTKDSGKERIACVRVPIDVDLGSDGCIARPYGLDARGTPGRR